MQEPVSTRNVSPLEQIIVIFQWVISKLHSVSISPAGTYLFFMLAGKCVRERRYCIEAPITELAKEFSISPVTARKGINELVELGIIKKQRGKSMSDPMLYFWVSPFPTIEVQSVSSKKSRVPFKDIIEALIFASGDPITIEKLSVISGASPDKVGRAIKAISKKYETGPVQLTDEAMGYALATRVEFAEYIKKVKKPKNKVLSDAELEVLAMVLYLAPVERKEVSRIRGVDSGRLLQELANKGLIEEIKKKEDAPPLFTPTQKALSHFGIKGKEDLPPR